MYVHQSFSFCLCARSRRWNNILDNADILHDVVVFTLQTNGSSLQILSVRVIGFSGGEMVCELSSKVGREASGEVACHESLLCNESSGVGKRVMLAGLLGDDILDGVRDDGVIRFLQATSRGEGGVSTLKWWINNETLHFALGERYTGSLVYLSGEQEQLFAPWCPSFK